MAERMTDRILALMGTQPEAKWASYALAAALDVPPDHIATALYRLRGWGAVERVSHGVHTLAEQQATPAVLEPEPTPPAPDPEPCTPEPDHPSLYRPITARPPDERRTYDVLREHGSLSARQAACFLNTSYSRAEKLLDLLVQGAYATCKDGRYTRTVPA